LQEEHRKGIYVGCAAHFVDLFLKDFGTKCAGIMDLVSEFSNIVTTINTMEKVKTLVLKHQQHHYQRVSGIETLCKVKSLVFA
jgi:hypothetical protein